MSGDIDDIVCPNCGATVVSVPADRDLKTPLVCGHCHMVLRGPGPAEKAVETVKEAVEKVEARINRWQRD